MNDKDDKILSALSNALEYIAEIQSYDRFSSGFAFFMKHEIGMDDELIEVIQKEYFGQYKYGCKCDKIQLGGGKTNANDL